MMRPQRPKPFISLLTTVVRYETTTLFYALGALTVRVTAVSAAFAIGLVFVHWGRPIGIADLFSPFDAATNVEDLRAIMVNVVGIAVLSSTTTGVDVLNGRGDELWLRLARGYVTIAMIAVAVLVLVSLNQINVLSNAKAATEDNALVQLSEPARVIIPLIFGIELVACLAKIVNGRHMDTRTIRMGQS